MRLPVLVVLLAFLLGGGRAGAQEQSSIALPSTTLTFSSTYIADELGLWAKEGLGVKIVVIQGVGAPNAVIAGSVDFTLTTASTFARAAERGQRMLIIANMLDRPMMELVLRSDIAGFDANAPLAERAKLLRGRTIAVDGIYTNLHAFMQLVALKGGLDPEQDVRVTAMPGPTMPAALATGAIDGFSSAPPFTNGAVASGKAVMLASSPRGDLPELLPFAYSVLMTRPALCRDHPSICRKMVQGYVAAAHFIHDHPQETVNILKKRFQPLDEALLAESVETVRKATPLLPAVTEAELQNSESFNVHAGVIKSDAMLKSFAGLYTDEFLH
jgi:NitT/TauT family transport system substrate-binding protein